MRGLKYVAWADTTGYAVAARSYLRALLRQGLPLTWTPLLCPDDRYREAPQAPPGTEPLLAAAAQCPLDYDTVLLHTVPEYYPEWLARERAPGRRILGYTVWELERLPPHWPAILNQLDGVLLPCRWNLEVFRRSGVTVPLHLVPHLSQFDPECGPEEHARRALLRRLGGAQAVEGRFVFYSIGFWTNRKAPADVLEAYCRAFRRDDPVFLIIKTCAKDLTRWRRHWRQGFRLRHPPVEESARALAARFPAAPPFALISDEDLPDAELQALHELGDAFVSLARTEGWGLGAFDAALRGKPVVMTGYGGQLDFLTPDLACLLDYERVPVHEPVWSASYRPGDQWAQPSLTQAVGCLRRLAAEPAEARIRAELLAARLRQEFAEPRVLEALLAALEGRP